jgi:DNA-binding GntR family transcriptional regulator
MTSVPSSVRRIKPQLDRVRRLGLPEPGLFGVLIADHTRITDSVAQGDFRSGEEHMRVHCRRVLEDAQALRTRYPHYFCTAQSGIASSR